MKLFLTITGLAALAVALGLYLTAPDEPTLSRDMEKLPDNTEIAVFGGGCFWCTEAVYERIDGVLRVESGYMGGTAEEANYDAVSTGKTGHAEVIKVSYDPEQVSYEELVNLHFISHDPTTLNRQGADEGPQYRSVIFTFGDAQRETAERVLAEVDASEQFADPIVTQVVPAMEYYPAEDYHQDFYSNNTSYGYCRVVITPKLKKLGLE